MTKSFTIIFGLTADPLHKGHEHAIINGVTFCVNKVLFGKTNLQKTQSLSLYILPNKTTVGQYPCVLPCIRWDKIISSKTALTQAT